MGGPLLLTSLCSREGFSKVGMFFLQEAPNGFFAVRFFNTILRQCASVQRFKALLVWLLLGLSAAVAANPPSAGTTIRNEASATYVPSGFTQIETVSNAVEVTVLAVEALSLTQDQTLTRPPGMVVSLVHWLKNTGNASSSYLLNLVNDPSVTGCPANPVALAGLRLVRDVNGNGVVDPADSPITLNTPNALTLQPGESSGLIVQGTMPLTPTGTVCLSLTATTQAQNVTARNQDIITIGNAAILSLYKTANIDGVLVAGTRINYNLTSTNVGAGSVLPTPVTLPALGNILVDSRPTALILLRDAVPAGTQYIAGSLQTAYPGALRLFRLQGDPEFSYRTGADDASAVEVAIGLPAPAALSAGASVQMGFAVRVAGTATSDVLNTAQAHYNDGNQTALAPSNTTLSPLSQARIGVAKSASMPIANTLPNGTPDGTSDVTFSLRVKNYGSALLYHVQLEDLLEGTGSTQFGTYTTATTPAQGQYTIVPSSVRVTYPNGAVGGTVASANTAFTGTASQKNLLTAGAVLPANAEFTVVFTVRINTVGRQGAVFNTAQAKASLMQDLSDGQPIVDDSVDGADPDPDRDGNPNNNTSPTSFLTQQPSIRIAQFIDVPKRVTSGVYDIPLTYFVTNTSAVEAPFVRVINNLNCTFEMDLSTGKVASWAITEPVRTKNGYLVPSTNFTGGAGIACDRSKITSTSDFQFPTEIALTAVDGTRPLLPGQTEEVSFTVRVTLKSLPQGSEVRVTNKVWAAAFSQNTINLTPGQVLAATVSADASSVPTFLVDPAGTVYDASTRTGIAGATVYMSRVSCQSGTPGPILPSEILGGSIPGRYTYLQDGSVSTVTDASGAWNLHLLSPPVNSLCTYRIRVEPPVNSAYVFPSETIRPTAGTYTGCGAVVPNIAPPRSGEPTTYYLEYLSGGDGQGSVCGVTNAHIPLDSGRVNGLVLKKEANQQRVEFGDFLDYTLTLTNKSGALLSGLGFDDQLPAGFAYVPGSSRFNGAAAADPSGGQGPQLAWRFSSQDLAAEASAVLRYRVRVGVGAQLDANATNRALALGGGMQSNLASATVRVDAGVFSDKAFLFGKVYMQCKKPGADDDTLGVPGVRLWLEDGTFAVTDANGKWSLYGLRPQTHVVRLDETTLPKGARVVLLDNRNSGNPASRFADVKKGEFHKADFPVSGCDDAQTLAEVNARRTAAQKLLDTQMESDVRVRIDPKGAVAAAADPRGLPASGSVGVAAGLLTPTPTGGALIALPSGPVASGGPVGTGGAGSSFLSGGVSGGFGGSLSTAAQGPGAQPSAPAKSVAAPVQDLTRDPFGTALPVLAPGIIELEKLLPDLDNTPAILDLKDGDTLPSQNLNVRLKGPAGAQLRLWINEQLLDLKRVGKRATLPKTSATAWEYIGVQLQPGKNRLRMEVHDEFGIRRAQPIEITLTAPDKLGAVHLRVPAQARADLKTAIPVQVRLTDAQGVVVTARTQLTLEASGGVWQAQDLNPDEPGLQTFLEGGQGEFKLIAPGTPGDLRIRVTASSFMKEARLSLLPELRPMLAVGIVEGTLDLSKRGSLALDQAPAGAAFEQELSSLSKDGEDPRLGGRAAFFLKGAIKGEYLLTASLDTAKSSRERLFRQIRPDEFYPVYGDASGKGFDAQSSGRLYVRIDKDRSFLLYGDFITASSQEVRRLSQVNRTLNGIRHVYQTDNERVTSYVSRTSQKKQVEEFSANGTSGPFYLAGASGEVLFNSEQLEIVVRDRNQPNVILSRTALARFVDYTFEPLTRRILFTRAIPSLSPDFHPQSLRVTYETDEGGPKYTVAGVDAQFKVNEQLQLGIVANTDQNPEAKRDLTAVTALARLDAHTAVAAEWVQTRTDLQGSGAAGRVEIRHDNERWGASAHVAHSDARFDNPDAGFAAGRTEANARAEYRLDKTTALRGEVTHSQDSASGTTRQSVNAGVLKKLNDHLTGELGVRVVSGGANQANSLFNFGSVSTTGAAANGQVGNAVTQLGAAANIAAADAGLKDIRTIRGRLTANIPNVPQAQVFLEAEQSIAPDNHGRVAAVGGQYALNDKTRLYGRYEFDSSLYEQSTLMTTRNVGIFGVESNYMEGGRVYNEFRLADATAGRGSQAASGVRNTIKLSDHWRGTIGLEKTKAVGMSSSGSTVAGAGDSTALITGLEYSNDGIRGSGILEGRNGSDVHTVLASFGLGLRLDQDWSLLTRNIYNASRGRGTQAGVDRILSRSQIGLAYRPVGQDVWNLLTRYERKTESGTGSTAAVGSISGNAFGANAGLNGDYVADIVSMHLNVNPRRGQYFAGRVAAKRSQLNDAGISSSYSAQLVSARWIQDLSADWDWGIQGSLMHGAGATQRAWGVEVGYQAMKDLWLSVGYNFTGLSDRDLTAGEYTSKGLYLRVRMKFDEVGLGLATNKSAMPH